MCLSLRSDEKGGDMYFHMENIILDQNELRLGLNMRHPGRGSNYPAVPVQNGVS